MHARPPARRKTSRRAAPRRARARRRRTRRAWLISIGILIPVLIGGALVWGGGFALTALAAAIDDSLGGVRSPVIDPDRALPPDPIAPNIAGYGVEQLGNACTILTAGRDLGFDERDQTIAVMTAMGESSLRNIDYGDWETNGVTNPDGSPTTSIGLFQQQDNWGTREERLDPYTAATLFYRAMAKKVPDRAALDPTVVAHDIQVNADPLHYARYWDRALRVVAALGGAPTGDDKIDGIPLCPAG